MVRVCRQTVQSSRHTLTNIHKTKENEATIIVSPPATPRNNGSSPILNNQQMNEFGIFAIGFAAVVMLFILATVCDFIAWLLGLAVASAAASALIRIAWLVIEFLAEFLFSIALWGGACG